MIRLTLFSKGDMFPGNLTIDPHVVQCVAEDIVDGLYQTAHVYMPNGTYWVVNDPQRDVASRIAWARGEYGEMTRC